MSDDLSKDYVLVEYRDVKQTLIAADDISFFEAGGWRVIEPGEGADPGEWEYQCRLNPLLSDGTPGSWHAVDPEHNCGGELRRRRIGEWEKVER